MRKGRAAGRKRARGKASAAKKRAKRPAKKPAKGAKRPKAAARRAATRPATRPAAAPAHAAGGAKELEREVIPWQPLHSPVQEQLRQPDSSIASTEEESSDLRKKLEELTRAQKGKGPAG